MSHAPAGPAWLVWLETTALADAMRQWLWLYPIVEMLHIAGIVLLVGAAAMFDFRLLGFSKRLPVSDMARHLLPWARVGLGALGATGVLLFVAHATEFASNPAFQLKVALIAVACLNAAIFHRWPFRAVSAWNVSAEAPGSAKAAAVASLTLWAGVIACGRLLAYL
ncbi:MAG TPA: hypothetical protein VLF19_12590 [Methylomirabilota bacterium]|nr:hypothetical protein [Methylomirabilota bacterium]